MMALSTNDIFVSKFSVKTLRIIQGAPDYETISAMWCKHFMEMRLLSLQHQEEEPMVISDSSPWHLPSMQL